MTTIDTHISTERQASLHDYVTAALASVSEMLITLFDWQHSARQRQQLLGLSDEALKDFGASRADAEGEGSKPFWRA